MNNNNGRGIFYGVIGVATLVVAIIGATFAYFTAAASNSTTITGNAATVALSLNVSKVTVADNTSGLIPMSNSMVQAAVSNSSSNGICKDANGNAVCQIYKITVSSTSSAAVFVDGYVALTGGSTKKDAAADYASTNNETDMRWAQVFCTDVDSPAEGADSVTSCSTAGSQVLSGTLTKTYTSLDAESDPTGLNTANIKTTSADILGSASADGSNGLAINYIRVSDDKATAEYTGTATFSRTTDLTTALVYNQSIAASTGTAVTSSYYIVVWLSETGSDQTLEGTAANSFFNGLVKFVSAQGGEVSATFQSYTRVPSGTPAATTE